MTSDHVDVLIVGAGPTGMTLAAELTAHGVRPRLIDRTHDRVHESRALAIQPRTLEVLAGLGITDQLLEHGSRAVQFRIHAGRRETAVPLFDFGLADTAYPYLLFLSQAETERILGDHLTAVGVTVERGVHLVGLESGVDEVSASLRYDNGREKRIMCRYVVGCDGAHSTVRTVAGIGFEGSSYPQTFVLADAEADGIDDGAVHAFLSERGVLFFFPLGTPASWRLLVMRPPADPTSPDAPVSLDEIQAIADTYTHHPVRLHDPVWMSNFRLHHRAATVYQAERVFLAGDAAHIHSPAGAQGMNTGIQDAVNLAWKLAHTLRGVSAPAVLDTYQSERAPVGAAVLRFTDRAFTIATSTNPIVRFARTHVAAALIPLVLKRQTLRGYAFRTVSQLSIRYRQSPLSFNGSGTPGSGPRAGDRLPDAPVTTARATTSLHNLTAAPRWHLLLCGPGWPADVAQLGRSRGDVIAVHQLDGPEHTRALRSLHVAPQHPAMLLIRPDGHIGYRGNGADTRNLESYLDRWLPKRHTPEPGVP